MRLLTIERCTLQWCRTVGRAKCASAEFHGLMLERRVDTSYKPCRSTAASALTCQACGVHAQIAIGQTASLAGAVVAGAQETPTGARLHIDAVNAHGGVNAPSGFQYTSPKRAAGNARQAAAKIIARWSKLRPARPTYLHFSEPRHRGSGWQVQMTAIVCLTYWAGDYSTTNLACAH